MSPAVHTVSPPHILVGFASKHGSTAEIAEAIATEICAHGVVADALPAGEIRDLSSYGAVVLGSATYMGRWRHEARHFLRHFRGELGGRPFWVFSSGPVGDPAKDPGDRWVEPRSMVEAIERLGVRDHVVFGGRVPQDPGNFAERAMLRDTPAGVADRRDWPAIRAWAADIAEAVRTSSEQTAQGIEDHPSER